MFGGTFDPIHVGHLRSAIEVREMLELDQLHLLPAARPPLREHPGVSARQRLALLELAIADTPGLIADGRELLRDGPSYSVETLQSLRLEYGDRARLLMVLGHDAFLRLPHWHCPEQVLDLAHLVVLDRPGHDAAPDAELSALIKGRMTDCRQSLMSRPAGLVFRCQLPTALDISATAIRHRLSHDQSVRWLVPEAVEQRLHEKRLYRSD